ncbi:MAG: class I SAM-dependent methyltransferase, partial [Caldilineaceae bacterium]|nr:class I SAM-dependent methyltransferase [Caldilineaceae bacterium]
AIDLGCGEGTDTRALLQRGWQVLAIDREPEAITRVQTMTPPALQPQLQTAIAAFEAVTLPTADLLYAGYSLPFCPPPHFAPLWQKIVRAINPGGRFVGQIFGDRDEWRTNQQMTFLTEAATRALFTGFVLEYVYEIDEDGEAFSGPKHWHYFDIIARKEQPDDAHTSLPPLV